MRRDKNIVKENNFNVAIKATLFGATVGAIVCAIFLFLFAFLFVFVKSIPLPMLPWIALVCAAFGALLAGYVATRVHGSNGLVYGASAALTLFLMLTLIAFFISRDKFTYITLIKFFIMTISGVIGGVFAANRKKHR